MDNLLRRLEGDHFCCGAFGLGCSASNHRSGTFFWFIFFGYKKKNRKKCAIMFTMKNVIAVSMLSILLASCSLLQPSKPPVSEQPLTETGSVESDSSSGAVIIDPCAEKHGDPQDHCYQNYAVEMEDPEICKKVQGERYLSEKKNPPRNKCISMVAAKTCTPALCDKIKRGEFYTPIKCRQRISRLCP